MYQYRGQRTLDKDTESFTELREQLRQAARDRNSAHRRATRYKAENETLRHEIQRLKTVVDTQRATIDDLTVKLKKANEAQDAPSLSADWFEKMRRSYQARIAELTAENGILKNMAIIQRAAA